MNTIRNKLYAAVALAAMVALGGCGTHSPELVNNDNPSSIHQNNPSSAGSCQNSSELQRIKSEAPQYIRDRSQDMTDYGGKPGNSNYYVWGANVRTMANSYIEYANSLWTPACDSQYQAVKSAVKSALSAFDSKWSRYNPSSPALASWSQ